MRPFALLLALLPTMAHAQSWCPPGATWTYEAGMSLAGFHRMTYTHDSVVAGYPAQVIDRYSAIQYPQPPPGPTFGGPPYITYYPVVVITREENEVVYTWQGGAWDTLYWFGAVPGDHWYPAHINDTICQPLVVSDTSTLIIDGMALRRLEVAGTTVIERVGCTWDMFLYCPNLIIDGPMGMRCYSDDEISYQLVSGACEQLVGMEEKEQAGTHVFPNPGTTHFTLDLTPGPHTVSLYDATGRMVHQQRTSDPRPVVHSGELPAGLYRIIVHQEEGGVRGTTWVKH